MSFFYLFLRFFPFIWPRTLAMGKISTFQQKWSKVCFYLSSGREISVGRLTISKIPDWCFSLINNANISYWAKNPELTLISNHWNIINSPVDCSFSLLLCILPLLATVSFFCLILLQQYHLTGLMFFSACYKKRRWIK